MKGQNLRGFQGQIHRCLWEISGREEARGDQMDRIHERKVPSNIIMISVGQSGSRGKRRLPAASALPRRAFLSYLPSPSRRVYTSTPSGLPCRVWGSKGAPQFVSPTLQPAFQETTSQMASIHLTPPLLPSKQVCPKEMATVCTIGTYLPLNAWLGAKEEQKAVPGQGPASRNSLGDQQRVRYGEGPTH